MKFPWQKSDSSTDAPTEAAAGLTAASDLADGAGSTAPEENRIAYPKGYTAPKGRPTPTRREREIERGVIRDPDKAGSPAQASQRRKELKKSMSKQEWREYKRKERAESRERNKEYQKHMDAGDERYLPANDRGPERRYARDWVDSHRFLNNLVMPIALALLVIMVIGTMAPLFANIMSLLAMIVIIAFFIEGISIGRRCNKAVRAKFPETTATGFGLGMYAYSRATQLRRWRSPKPRVEIGAQI